jgi:DNA-3-methyladenine glycosylase II
VNDFVLEPRGPFDLSAAARFIAGWPPAARPGAAAGDERVVGLGFLVDDWSGHAGVVLRQRHVDGPVPVLFHSPYEAACWAVLSARIRQSQAARVRDELSFAHGATLPVEGEMLPGFPAPERLLAVGEARGLSEEKLRRLHGVAEVALAGDLDRDRLLAAPYDEALATLRAIRGIGPFWAEGILLRAVGTTDALTLGEKRGRAAAAEAYGAPAAVDDDGAFLALAERWRPFRTWVAVLLRATA